MSEKITNEQYTKAMYTLQTYITQLNCIVDLECIQNILLAKMQEINRQIVKVKDYERLQADCLKEQLRLKEMRT
jgi:uncharacterized LabA/DUF88 family protein